MYGRQAPPGFAPINPPMGDPHDYPMAEKPAYASNLFNQPTVERRFAEPSGMNLINSVLPKMGVLSKRLVEQMEVAGVFWDIENCAVPHQKSAFALVQRIREKMFQHLREVEFMCACDAGKETKTVMDELNSAQGKLQSGGPMAQICYCRKISETIIYAQIDLAVS